MTPSIILSEDPTITSTHFHESPKPGPFSAPPVSSAAEHLGVSLGVAVFLGGTRPPPPVSRPGRRVSLTPGQYPGSSSLLHHGARSDNLGASLGRLSRVQGAKSKPDRHWSRETVLSETTIDALRCRDGVTER